MDYSPRELVNNDKKKRYDSTSVMTDVYLERLPCDTGIPPSTLLVYSNSLNMHSYNNPFPQLITLVSVRSVALPRVKFNESRYLISLVYTRYKKIIKLGNRITKAYIWSNKIQCINCNTHIHNSKQSKSIINQGILYLSLSDNNVFSVPKLSFRHLDVEYNSQVTQPIIKESILSVSMPMHCLYKNTYLAKSVRQMGRGDIGGFRLNTRIYNFHRRLSGMSKITRKYNRIIANNYAILYNL